jgi:hypothetical protein
MEASGGSTLSAPTPSILKGLARTPIFLPLLLDEDIHNSPKPGLIWPGEIRCGFAGDAYCQI